MIPSLESESPLLPGLAAVQIYQFHVLLLTISPAIWRRFLIRSDSTIADLHYILQILMGWDDEHLHQFTIHGRHFGVEHIGGIYLLYEYDFNDYW